MLHNLDVWPNETPTSVDFQQLKVIQTFFLYLPRLSLRNVKFLRSLDSSAFMSFGRDECVHQLVRNTYLVWSQLGFTLPTNSTLFCRQWTDGSACLQALPGDLHDALIIQIFDSHEVSDSFWIVHWVNSVWPHDFVILVTPLTVCVCVFVP